MNSGDDSAVSHKDSRCVRKFNLMTGGLVNPLTLPTAQFIREKAKKYSKDRRRRHSEFLPQGEPGALPCNNALILDATRSSVLRNRDLARLKFSSTYFNLSL